MPSGVYTRKPSAARDAMIKRNFAKGRQPEARKKAAAVLKKIASDPEWRKKVSIATKKALNQPEIRKKHLKSIKESLLKHGCNFRGGNGQPLIPIIEFLSTVLVPLGFVREFPVRTKGHTSSEIKVPSNYKVDFGRVGDSLAVEVDGPCHRSPERRELDRKKQSVLKSLGWIIIRITHD